MKTGQSNLLNSIFPLVIVFFIITIVLILSFIYDVHKYPLWFNEDGIIESLSAYGYFAAALLIVFIGKWSYLARYYYFFILIILFGLRELGFHKKFTTMGIFRIKYYLSNHVPLLEKAIVILFVISLILYVFVPIIKNHSKGFFIKIKQISPVHMGVLITFLVLLFTKSIDGLARKLAKLNIVITEQTSIHFTVIEEVLEMGAPLLIIATLIIYFQQNKHDV